MIRWIQKKLYRWDLERRRKDCRQRSNDHTLYLTVEDFDQLMYELDQQDPDELTRLRKAVQRRQGKTT